jgi:hypothetical protein
MQGKRQAGHFKSSACNAKHKQGKRQGKRQAGARGKRDEKHAEMPWDAIKYKQNAICRYALLY